MVGRTARGSYPTIAQYILPPLLAELHAEHPDISVIQISANTDIVEGMLEKKQIDIGLVEGEVHGYFQYVPFLRDEIIPVVRAHSRIASTTQAMIPINELPRMPLALYERTSDTCQAVHRSMTKQGIELSALNVVVYMDSTEGLKNYLSYADCVGFFSTYAVEKELRSGLFQRLQFDGFNIEREFYFVLQRSLRQPLQQLFIDQMRRMAEEK